MASGFRGNGPQTWTDRNEHWRKGSFVNAACFCAKILCNGCVAWGFRILFCRQFPMGFQGRSTMIQSNRMRALALCLLAIAFFIPLGCKSNSSAGAAQSGAGISGPLTMLPDYQARAPRTCSPVTSPPSVAQATVMVQCSMDGLSDLGLGLIQDVNLQMASSRPFAFWTDAGLAGIDQKADVYPLQGSYTGYFCRLSNTATAGQSCLKSAVPVAQGWCWKTSVGEWKCKMQGGAPTTVASAPPTTF
jgi:hypothetical protein